MFLLEKNKGIWVNLLELCALVILEKAFWLLLFILINNLRNLFIVCININSDQMLL